MSFFDELKRRNVVRVGLAYGIASWVFLQVADLVLENIEAPSWVIKALMLIVLLGFIAAVVIAWAYEITPEGIKADTAVHLAPVTAGNTDRKLIYAIFILVLLVAGFQIADRILPEEIVTTGPESPALAVNSNTDIVRSSLNMGVITDNSMLPVMYSGLLKGQG